MVMEVQLCEYATELYTLVNFMICRIWLCLRKERWKLQLEEIG